MKEGEVVGREVARTQAEVGWAGQLHSSQATAVQLGVQSAPVGQLVRLLESSCRRRRELPVVVVEQGPGKTYG